MSDYLRKPDKIRNKHNIICKLKFKIKNKIENKIEDLLAHELSECSTTKFAENFTCLPNQFTFFLGCGISRGKAMFYV